MSRTRWLLVLAAVCAVVLTGCSGAEEGADAATPQPLLLTPSDGDVFTTESTLDQTIEMTIMGQTVEIMQTIQENTEWRVGTESSDGTVDVQVTTTRFQLTQEGPDSFEQYDSDDPDAVPQSDLAVRMAALANVPVRMRITPTGEITITGGMDALYNNMADLSGAQSRTERDSIRAYFRNAFPTEELAQEYESDLPAYTSEPVAPGSTWTVHATTSFLAPIRFDGSMRLDSLTGHRAFISGRGDVQSVPVDSVSGSINGPFQDVDLSGTRTVSSALHRRTGFPIRRTVEQRVSGDGVIRSGGGDLKAQVTLTSTISQTANVQSPSEAIP
ncbi:hypothetical protein CRI94_06745 [Longibacter salinarum]|uniref:Uncharacterized protein n=1 Tax=Longibacter salinarum TaxID=1850348 RepID=A0A2A8CYJ5_9BACT|nr:DUF6263 family protein [Longibacter salinarum]PEN13765.1 hypothetical protein CRI94_06745 [Longibacter salinarum]